MENQRTDDDFWLMQYQKLIDQRDGVMQKSQASIDPLLGYNFLLNGVIHVMPFLMKIWNRKDFDIQKITEKDLADAGIKNAKDRQGVMKSIKDFLSTNPIKSIENNERDDSDLEEDEACCSKQQVPTAPQESITKSPTSSASSSSREQAINNAVECVVCMDAQTRVIFLPCGMFFICIYVNEYLPLIII